MCISHGITRTNLGKDTVGNSPHGRVNDKIEKKVTRTALSVHTHPQWYQNKLISMIHISHPQKDEQSFKSRCLVTTSDAIHQPRWPPG